MPELRQDPLSGRWVVIATGRAKRPEAFVPPNRPTGLPPYAAECPFCPGNEAATPPEVLAHRPSGGRPDDGNWTLRVVPNKFAAFDGADGWTEEPVASILEQRSPAYGTAEVIIETRRHDRTLSLATDAEVATVLDCYVQRYQALSERPGYAYLMPFRNYGSYAGASQDHPHSQIIAMPSIPPAVELELSRSRHYHDAHGRCLLCDVVRREREVGERIVADDGDFVVIAPYASRSPFELMLLPAEHGLDFATLGPAEIERMAAVLGRTMRMLDRALHDPPYNYYLHTLPPGSSGDAHQASYHWHLTILPRLTQMAGFELGSGTLINITLPEAAAAFLRAHA